MEGEFAVSVEEELQLVDPEGGGARGRADPGDGRGPGSDRPMHATVADAVRALAARRRAALARARASGLATIAAGIHPAGSGGSDARGGGWLAGAGTGDLFDLRVRVAMPNREAAVRAMCGAAPYLPALLALAGSSPFHHGEDTGYASFRTIRRDVFPRVGPPFPVATAGEFDRLERLFAAGEGRRRPLAWDVHPVAGESALEFRLFDATPRLATVAFLAAGARALAALFADRPPAMPSGLEMQVLRENRWRAARDGLAARFLRPEMRPETWSALDALTALADRLGPVAERLGDAGVLRSLGAVVEAGTAAEEMRRVFGARGRIPDVVEHLVVVTNAMEGLEASAATSVEDLEASPGSRPRSPGTASGSGASSPR